MVVVIIVILLLFLRCLRCGRGLGLLPRNVVLGRHRGRGGAQDVILGGLWGSGFSPGRWGRGRGVKDSRRIGVGLRSWHRNGVIGGRGGQFRRTLKRRVIYLHNWGRLPTHKVFKVQHFLGDSLLQRQDDDAGSVTPKKKEEKNRRQTDPKDGLEFLDENLHEA